MRTLLMVQDERGRVKCAKTFGMNSGLNRARAFAYVTKVKRRYWLVEAESAEAARWLIQEAVEGKPMMVRGRVIAQGGKDE